MDNQSMVILFILSILVIMIAMHLNNNRKQKKRIQQKWGTIPTETRMDSEESLNQSYEKLKTSLDFDSEVDDITWYDLDLFEVFKEINHTYSSVGSEALYRRLRLFNFNDQDQNRIEKLIAFYDENPKTREKIEFIFARLGKKDRNSVVRYLTDSKKKGLSSLAIFVLLGALPIVGLFLILFGVEGLGFTILVGSVLFNIIYSAIKKRKLIWN